MHRSGHRPLQLLLLASDGRGRVVRQAADVRLAARTRVVHREAEDVYGAPRVTAEFREAGEGVNRKRVARVVRSIGLAGVRL